MLTQHNTQPFRLRRDTDARFELPAPVAVCIGNFDGLHRGHQALIQRARSLAGAGTVAVLTFEPRPSVVLPHKNVPARLLRVSDKLRGLQDLGVEAVWMLRFSRAVAGWSPAFFIQRTLVEGLKADFVVVGDDFRFGARAAGDVAVLEKLGAASGFEVSVVDPVVEAEKRVSSTEIRTALAAGELALASRLLGRPYRISGHVVRGQQLGRDLGYATANVRMGLDPSPVRGIFAVRVDGRDTEGQLISHHPALASIGTRPTVGGEEWLLEVHLLDWQGELYGTTLQVTLVEKLRDEHHFGSLPAMIEQMQKDEAQARHIFS